VALLLLRPDVRLESIATELLVRVMFVYPSISDMLAAPRTTLRAKKRHSTRRHCASGVAQ